MAVIVENITKVYGSQKAVDNLSFTVEKGQILGFLGPNGAGKTTTMKMLSCFLPPTQGTASIYGYDIIKQPMEVKRIVGYLPEHNPLYLDMYVREYLTLVASIHKLSSPKSRIETLIEQTGLTKESKKKVGSLSKGYRQRVGLAQALMHDPEVLIMDEPTSGLDPNQLVEIRHLIKEIGKDKIVIFSSHIMQEIEALCDRVLIINNGKLVADDPIASLSARVKGGKVVFVGFEKTVDEAFFDENAQIESWHKEHNHYRLLVSDEIVVKQSLFDFAVTKNNRINLLSSEEISVEEVFQSLTKTNKVGND